MRHRRLIRTVLLGASLLLAAGRSHGQSGDAPPSAQREVIATTGPATAETQPAPYTPPPSQPAPIPTPAAAPLRGATVQQASFIPDAPPPDAAPAAQPDRRMTENGLVRETLAPAPAATPAPAPAILPATGLMSGLPPAAAPTSPASAAAAGVSVEVSGPEQLMVGQPFTHEIVVRNAGPRTAGAVHIEEPLPEGAHLLHAEPPGQTRGDRLTWDLGNLEAGAERRLKIEVQPAGPGEMQFRPAVTFLSGSSLRTRVVRPQFGVEMTADHDKTTCGGHIAFTVRVSNRGETMIRGIKLYDQLPSGLDHPAVHDAKDKTVGITRFGDLQPGESRTIKLETTAVQAGQFVNEIVAQADGGVEGRARVAVVVTEASLSLRLDGPKQGVTQREIDYQVEVANPGPAPATKVRLVQTLPPSFEAVAASTGAHFDAAQHSLTWTLADLTPGQRQRITFRIKGRSAGDWPMYTAVQADKVPEMRVANVVRLEGAAALTLEVRAREERLAVGEETVYEMHVFNQGDAPCAGVRLTAALPDEVTPLDARGPVAGQVQQQQVQFPPLAQLPSRGDAVYRIRVRGQRPGKGHVRAVLTAEQQRSVQSELSIQVNAGAAVAGSGAGAASTGVVPVGATLPAIPKPPAGEGLR